MSDDATPAPEVTTQEDVRTSPAFLAVTKQLNELRAQMEASELAKTEAAKAEEMKKLAEKGEFELALQKSKAEMEALKASSERATKELTLKYELAQLGINDETYIAGVIAQYDGQGDMKEYVAEVAKKSATLFTPKDPVGIAPPGAVSPASSGNDNWAQTKADLTDPLKAKAAGQRVTEYFSKHKKMPF